MAKRQVEDKGKYPTGTTSTAPGTITMAHVVKRPKLPIPANAVPNVLELVEGAQEASEAMPLGSATQGDPKGYVLRLRTGRYGIAWGDAPLFFDAGVPVRVMDKDLFNRLIRSGKFDIL